MRSGRRGRTEAGRAALSFPSSSESVLSASRLPGRLDSRCFRRAPYFRRTYIHGSIERIGSVDERNDALKGDSFSGNVKNVDWPRAPCLCVSRTYGEMSGDKNSRCRTEETFVGST